MMPSPDCRRAVAGLSPDSRRRSPADAQAVIRFSNRLLMRGMTS